MNNVISPNQVSDKTSPRRSRHRTSLLFDLSTVSEEVLHILAKAMLQNHCKCPSEILSEFKRRIAEHQNLHNSLRDQVKARGYSDKLNAHLQSCMQNAEITRFRIDQFLSKGVPSENVLLFPESDFKAPDPAVANAELWRIVGELVIDERMAHDAKYHAHKVHSLRKTVADYAKGKLILQTPNGPLIAICSRN